MIRLRWFTVVAIAGAAFALGAPVLSGQAGIEVTFTDWDAATPDGHPHEPAFRLDGHSLWYTGQRSHKLGRVADGTPGRVTIRRTT
jgi:hypothetical protein